MPLPVNKPVSLPVPLKRKLVGWLRLLLKRQLGLRENRAGRLLVANTSLQLLSEISQVWVSLFN